MASATQPLCPVPRLRNPATVAALASIGLYAAALCLLCLLLRQMGWEAFYLELSSVVGNLFQPNTPSQPLRHRSIRIFANRPRIILQPRQPARAIQPNASQKTDLTHGRANIGR